MLLMGIYLIVGDLPCQFFCFHLFFAFELHFYVQNQKMCWYWCQAMLLAAALLDTNDFRSTKQMNEIFHEEKVSDECEVAVH